MFTGAQKKVRRKLLRKYILLNCVTIKAMDVSADLHELARCPVGLVSGGVKSILDIGRSVHVSYAPSLLC